MIYRETSIMLSEKRCASFLRAVAATKGCIKSSHATSAYYHPDNINRCSMHFVIKFPDNKALDKFHELGFITLPTENLNIS